MNRTVWIPDPGSQILGPRSPSTDAGTRALEPDLGSLIPDLGSLIQYLANVNIMSEDALKFEHEWQKLPIPCLASQRQLLQFTHNVLELEAVFSWLATASKRGRRCGRRDLTFKSRPFGSMLIPNMTSLQFTQCHFLTINTSNPGWLS